MAFNFIAEAQKVMRNSGRHYCPNCATTNYRIKTAEFLSPVDGDSDDIQDMELVCSCNECGAEWEQMATLYIDETNFNVLDEGDAEKSFCNPIKGE